MPLEQTDNFVNEEAPRVSPELGEVGVAVVELIEEFVPPPGSSAGARLDRGLAMDQRLREARTRVMQRRIHAAYRLETRARNVCVGAGLGSILLWLAFLTPVAASDRSGSSLLMASLMATVMTVAIAVAVSLPVAAVIAVLSARWRRHLVRTASEQHLQVHDPGQFPQS